MNTVRDIASAKDLRATTFFDLFYEIVDNPDGQEIADQIVERIEPGFSLISYKETLEAQNKLPQLRQRTLEAVVEEAERKYRHFPEIEEMMRRRANVAFFDQVVRIDFKKTLEAKGEDPDADNVEGDINYSLVVSMLGDVDTSDEPTRHVIHWLMDVDGALKGFIEYLDRRIEEAEGMVPQKYLVSLLLLPQIDNDQDMIVFFGNNFHTTFANVDAYSGLLYAFEYFEFIGQI